MIEIGNRNKKIKNKDRWNCCHHFPILTFLGANNCLPLLNMANLFWLLETSECINEFDILYMISQTLHVNKILKEQVEKCMNNTFVSLTKPFI